MKKTFLLLLLAMLVMASVCPLRAQVARSVSSLVTVEKGEKKSQWQLGFLYGLKNDSGNGYYDASSFLIGGEIGYLHTISSGLDSRFVPIFGFSLAGAYYTYNCSADYPKLLSDHSELSGSVPSYYEEFSGHGYYAHVSAFAGIIFNINSIFALDGRVGYLENYIMTDRYRDGDELGGGLSFEAGVRLWRFGLGLRIGTGGDVPPKSWTLN